MEDADEAFVETVQEDPIVDDGDEEQQRMFHQQQHFAQQQPTGIRYAIMVLLSVNPWLYVAAALVAWFLWRKFGHLVTDRLEEWRWRREEAAEAAAIKKNPDLYRARLEAMDEHRRRLQERYDVQAAEAAEAAAIKEEERRKQKVEELENLMAGKGYRNKVRVAEAEFHDGVDRSDSNSSQNRAKKNSSLRPGYNPLMGGGGGGGYRPARRNLGGSGGG